MSVTTTMGPGCLDPQPGRWLYDLATLASVGVALAPCQQRLLDPGSGAIDVLVTGTYPDPYLNVDGYRSFAELPALTVTYPDGRVARPVAPLIGRLDWSLDGVGELGEFHQDGWTMFPTVPVCLAVPIDRDDTEEIASAQRCWNVWPLDDLPEDAKWALASASEAAYATGWYARATTWSLVHHRAADYDLCSLVGHESGEHEHADDICLQGAAAYLIALEELCGGVPGAWRPPPPVAIDDGQAAAVFAYLAASGAANHLRALDVVPDWERQALASTESRYSPWVLS